MVTTAPRNIQEVRGLLLAHLNLDPDTIRSADLEPAEVGIVGNPDHRGGYHCGLDRVNASSDYSVVESSRDRQGLTSYASALDVGPFSVVSGGRTHNLRTFSTWCVAQCKAGAPDTRDIREVIYSPDGEVVHRWDALGRRTSGDSSHLTHTHFSFFRDATRAGRDLTPLFRRYLSTIGLLAGEDDDMTPGESWALHVINYRVEAMRAGRAIINIPARPDLGPDYKAVTEPNRLAAAAQPASTDEEAIVAGVLSALTPEKIAAAIPPGVAKAVLDELATRVAS